MDLHEVEPNPAEYALAQNIAGHFARLSV